MGKANGLASIVGQEEVIRRLRAFAALFMPTMSAGLEPDSETPAADRQKIPGHILLTGAEGMGKRTIARAFAADYCGHLVETSAPALARTGELLGILTNLGEVDALLIVDIDKLSKALAISLYPALKDFFLDFVFDPPVSRWSLRKREKTTAHVPLKRFVTLATAHSATACPRELLECFHLTIPVVQRYSDAELAVICERVAQQKNILISPDVAFLVAGACRGSPHEVELLVVRLSALGKTAITPEDAAKLFSVLGLSAKVGSGLGSFTQLDAVSGIEFERAISDLLERMGFRAQMTRATGDGGIDIVATLERPILGGKYLFQCKHFASDNLVGAATVREFYGAVIADREAVKGILITTSGFTQQALEFARQLPVELIGGDKLRELLLEHGMTPGPTPPKPSLF